MTKPNETPTLETSPTLHGAVGALVRLWRTERKLLRFAVVLVPALLLTGFSVWFFADSPWSEAGFAIAAVGLVLLKVLDSYDHVVNETAIHARIERAEQQVAEHPEKARPVWDLARSRLELYFERNLSQVRSIFWITVIVMLVGFALIVYGVMQSFNVENFNAALLTTTAGVITEVIAATFLVIYRSTMSQANDFVKTLERINAVGMSLQILDSIPESAADTKNDARVKLVELILTNAAPATVSSQS